jgi:hypothetical protein
LTFCAATPPPPQKKGFHSVKSRTLVQSIGFGHTV